MKKKMKKTALRKIENGYQDFTELNNFMLWTCMNKFSFGQSEFTN